MRNYLDSETFKLCIEAGVKGWESIEFKELYSSACEYLNENQVYKVQITKTEDYICQVKSALEVIQPTHYFYDPRTGSQNWIKGLWQSFRLAFMLHLRGIIPIVLLTDLAIRSWRAQSSVVSATRGVVVILMAPRKIFPIFPHRRLVGPSLMPLSVATAKSFDSLSDKQTEGVSKKVIFAGSLYEPRTSILQEIASGLKERDLVLEIKGRKLGSPRSPDFEYWSTLSNAALVLTTADQMAKNGNDWSWMSHVVYRYIEVTACGSLLVAPEVPGIKRFLTPGKHFVPFTSPANAVDVIEYFLVHDAEREKITLQGKLRALALVNARSFWTGIDIALGKDSLT